MMQRLLKITSTKKRRLTLRWYAIEGRRWKIVSRPNRLSTRRHGNKIFFLIFFFGCRGSQRSAVSKITHISLNIFNRSTQLLDLNLLTSPSSTTFFVWDVAENTKIRKNHSTKNGKVTMVKTNFIYMYIHGLKTLWYLFGMYK